LNRTASFIELVAETGNFGGSSELKRIWTLPLWGFAGSPSGLAKDDWLLGKVGKPGGGNIGNGAIWFIEVEAGTETGNESRIGTSCNVEPADTTEPFVGLMLNSTFDLDWARTVCTATDWLVNAIQDEVKKASN